MTDANHEHALPRPLVVCGCCGYAGGSAPPKPDPWVLLSEVVAERDALRALLRRATSYGIGQHPMYSCWKGIKNGEECTCGLDPLIHDIREALNDSRQNGEETWIDEPLPGGWVCTACGVPVESEPCPDHGHYADPEARNA